MTTSRVFLDTNVLVYWAYEGQDTSKHLMAVAAVESLYEASSALISAQVIGEFMRACARLEPGIPREYALESADLMLTLFPLVTLDSLTTTEALRAHRRYNLDYYDAQIWAAARTSGCDVILTEDTHGEEIEGVRYMNPFEPGFDLKTLLGG